MECTVIGGGFAGVEAAWFLAGHGIRVRLFEMRPNRETQVHQSGFLAEPVCSNSFKSKDISTGHGLLKAEMEILGSLVLQVAKQVEVPAGRALAVDRMAFAQKITQRIAQQSNIELVRKEVTQLPENEPVILAAGPLISDELAHALQQITGQESLSFYDAIAPIVAADSIDMSRAFWADRRSDGPGTYINCPMDRQEYERFIQALLEADQVIARDFEDKRFFEACLPVEVMGRRGSDTLRFGPMKPVGLLDPATGKRPYAVVQLRQENLEATMFTLVGFQTRLKYPDQKRVFSLIPALKKARFLRYGSIHRNTFINAPLSLDGFFRLKNQPNILIAGQLSGVEGYMESAASGILAGIRMWKLLQGQDLQPPPPTTMIGGLIRYMGQADPRNFQPMNANFGLITAPPLKKKGRERKLFMAQRSLEELKLWAGEAGL